MTLCPVEKNDIELVAQWMGEKQNHQWLDFGNGKQLLTQESIAIMTQRDIHCVRLIKEDAGGVPVGIVALSNIAHNFKTGTLWYVIGDKRYEGRGYATSAVRQILNIGFRELGLEAINAWVVEPNIPSIRVLERNNFSLVGRMRRCHYLDGQVYDRLVFDILASEHKVM